MFCGADENSQHSDDEDGTSTDEPNEQLRANFSQNRHTLQQVYDEVRKDLQGGYPCENERRKR